MIFSLFLSSTLLVSDFNRSAHLLSTFDLSHVAKDYLPLRTSTSALLTESTVVVSDHDQNLFFIDKSGASELRVSTFLRLLLFPSQRVAWTRTSSRVDVLRRGTLSNRFPSVGKEPGSPSSMCYGSSASPRSGERDQEEGEGGLLKAPELVWACEDGSLGLISKLLGGHEQLERLSAAQRKVEDLIVGDMKIVLSR